MKFHTKLNPLADHLPRLSFAGCTARTPGIESCNDVDDDCDTRTDEGITRACASICGSGMQTCMAGVYGMCTAPLPTVEICNALDATFALSPVA